MPTFSKIRLNSAIIVYAATLLLPDAGSCLVPATSPLASHSRIVIGELVSSASGLVSTSRIVVGELVDSASITEMQNGSPQAGPVKPQPIYNERGDTAVQEQTVFPLNLREAVQLAVNNNREIQIATLFPSIAREAQLSTASIYTPSLFSEVRFNSTDRPIQTTLDNGTDGSTGKDSLEDDLWYVRTGIRKPLSSGGIASLFLETDYLDSNSELVIPNPQYTGRLTVQLRQALLKERGDKSNQSNIRIAENNTRIAEEQYRKNLAAVLRDVAVSYWRFVYYHSQISISLSSIEQAELILSRLQNKKELGLANMIDLHRADAVLKDRKLTLYADRRNLKTAQDQLKLLLGLTLDPTKTRWQIKPTESIRHVAPQQDRDTVLNTALQIRPEIQIARMELNSTMIEKELAKHKLLPTLDATARYSRNSLGQDTGDAIGDTFENDQASWSLGLEFEYPFGNEQQRAEHRRANLIYKRKLLEVSKVKEQLGYEIDNALSRINELTKEIEAASGVASAYKGVLDRETTRFEMARADNQRLLDAQDDYFEARRNRLRAALNLNIAMLDLSWARGTLLEELNIEDHPNRTIEAWASAALPR